MQNDVHDLLWKSKGVDTGIGKRKEQTDKQTNKTNNTKQIDKKKKKKKKTNNEQNNRGMTRKRQGHDEDDDITAGCVNKIEKNITKRTHTHT